MPDTFEALVRDAQGHGLPPDLQARADALLKDPRQSDIMKLRSALMEIAILVGGYGGDPKKPEEGASSEFLALVANETRLYLSNRSYGATHT